MDPHAHLSRVGRTPILRVAGLLFAGLLLTGAGPAPQGTEVSLGVAYGRYEARPGTYRGVGQSLRVLEPSVDGAVRHRFDRGLTLSAGGSVAPGVARDPEQPDVEPELDTAYLWSGVATAQVGRHGTWVGFQLGPAMLSRPGLSPTAMVAGELWVGRPEYAYAWASLLQLPHTGSLGLGALGGVGHRSERFQVEAGTSGLGWIGRAGTRVAPGAWLHAEVGGGRALEDQLRSDLRGRLGLRLVPAAFNPDDPPAAP